MILSHLKISSNYVNFAMFSYWIKCQVPYSVTNKPLVISCRVQHFLQYKTSGLHTCICQESQGTPLEQMSLLIIPSTKTCHFMTSEEFNGTSCLRTTCQLVIIKIHHFWLSNNRLLVQSHLSTISNQHRTRVICSSRT